MSSDASRFPASSDFEAHQRQFAQKHMENAGGAAFTVWVLIGVYLFWATNGAHFFSWQALVYFVPGGFFAALLFGGGSYLLAWALTEASQHLSWDFGRLVRSIGGLVILGAEWTLMFFSARVLIGFLILGGQQVAHAQTNANSPHVIPIDSTPSNKLADLYFSRLDQWVHDGGKSEAVQSGVVENCGKLVMISATPEEAAAFLKDRHEDFDFRVDVCAKLTVTRSHPQPDFDKPEVRQIVCRDMAGSQPIFMKLCIRAGVTG